MDDFPNDFLKNRSGPSPLGQAQKRILDGVDAPYQVRRSGSTVTSKQDDFTQTRTTPSDLSLVGHYVSPANTVPVVLVDLAARATKQLMFGALISTGAYSPTVQHARIAHVGDGYGLTLYSNIGNVAPNVGAEQYWASLLRLQGAGDEVNQGGDEGRRTTSFIDQAVGNGGYYTTDQYISLVASGWDGTTKRWRFGMAAKYLGPLSNNFAIPVFFAGNTGKRSLAPVSFPSYIDRTHYVGGMYCAGPAKLIMLVAIANEIPPFDLIPPYFATSPNHGDTWTNRDATELAPYLTQTLSGVQYVYDDAQLGALARNNVITYLGDGHTMLTIPSGQVDMGGLNGAPRYAPMAFVASPGGNYTRVAWPADTWYTNAAGVPVDPEGSRVQFPLADISAKSAQLGFGKNCMYVPVWTMGGPRIMYTIDRGAKWTISPSLPATISANLTKTNGACLTVLAPYISTTSKGLLVIAAPDYTTKRVTFFAAAGDFKKFSKVFIYRPRDGLQNGANQIFDRTFTNFGGFGKPAIFPAFPKEFKKS